MPRDYAHYHVALKALLWKDGKVLFLKSRSGAFDLPGGRIDNIEDNIPLRDILDRELKEELGKNFVYKINSPIFQFRRFFPHKGWQIFLTVYKGSYISGDIVLSDEHINHIWIDPNSYEFKLEEFINREEYEAFIFYFESLNIEKV